MKLTKLAGSVCGWVALPVSCVVRAGRPCCMRCVCAVGCGVCCLCALSESIWLLWSLLLRVRVVACVRCLALCTSHCCRQRRTSALYHLSVRRLVRCQINLTEREAMECCTGTGIMDRQATSRLLDSPDCMHHSLHTDSCEQSALIHPPSSRPACSSQSLPRPRHCPRPLPRWRVVAL